MKKCVKCSVQLPDDAAFCHACGKKQGPGTSRSKSKRRGNGSGSVYRDKNGKWTAEVTIGYSEEDGKLHRKKRTRSGFSTKKEAMEFIPELRALPSRGRKKSDPTFKEIFDVMMANHDAGESTKTCYKAAFGHFAPLHFVQFNEIGIDDLQECIDECQNGKRTKQNMKVLASLMYKYAVPRGYTTEKINFGTYLKAKGEAGSAREAFTPVEVEQIRLAATAFPPVPYADYLYIHIYTGYRTQEFVSARVEDYDRLESTIRGGIKTEAGKNRVVTLSPKIADMVRRIAADRKSGPLFPDQNGGFFTPTRYRKVFNEVLKAVGITRTGLTPYSCRHTFATMLMRVADGSDKEKIQLMGHTSAVMTAHYQHPDLEDLRKITDAI